ncbi:hypothetical protein JXI42_04560 [bacterium]|nr:hypothetical protein [bacterium]
MQGSRILVIALIFVGCVLFSCGKNNGDGNNNDNGDSIDIPPFVNVNYIELDKIHKISKFRSAVGHDYSDGFEDCRSMKHYFCPESGEPGESHPEWSTVKIYSPVDGVVTNVFQEWAGTQVRIKSQEQPDCFFIIFHIDLMESLSIGETLSAGQQLGTHIGSQTMSDIAVGVDKGDGWKLISYFEVVTDSIFNEYQARGVTSRSSLIISEEERDADSLTCDGEVFINTGHLDDWVILD